MCKFSGCSLNLLTSCTLWVWRVSFFLWTSVSVLFTLRYLFQVLTDDLFFRFLNCVPLPFSFCLRIQCRTFGPLSGVQIDNRRYRSLSAPSRFRNKRKNCLFESEGLRHNTEFLLKPSEIIFDYHSLARYFSVSFDIWLRELTIRQFSLWS
jgi:hypothetical protein